MTKSIMAHEATVKTATVEVKALTVAGRQVTLSVFRQLRDEPVLDDDTVQLRGVPWGTVNYFWGDCAKAAEHLHVVWQKGDQLRRACVYPKPSSTQGWREAKENADGWFECWIQASVADGKITSEAVTGNYIRRFVVDRWYSTEMTRPMRDLMAWSPFIPRNEKPHKYGRLPSGGYGDVPMSTVEVAEFLAEQEQRNIDGKQSSTEHRFGFQESIRDDVVSAVGTIDVDELMEGFDLAAKKVREFEERWKDQYAALAELDHLFIAV